MRLESNTDVAETLKRCRTLAAQLMAKKITLQEYAYNTTLAVVNAPDDCMEECVASVPARASSEFMAFLRNFLEPVDFMPCPAPFLVDTGDNQKADEKKRELRPKYVRLFELTKNKVAVR